MKIRRVMARKGDTPEFVNKMQKDVFEVLAEHLGLVLASSEALYKILCTNIKITSYHPYQPRYTKFTYLFCYELSMGSYHIKIFKD
jgi:hypothetical protein